MIQQASFLDSCEGVGPICICPKRFGKWLTNCKLRLFVSNTFSVVCCYTTILILLLLLLDLYYVI